MRTWFCWHRFTVWSDPVNTISGYFRQWRVCTRCNLAQHRQLWWHNQTDLHTVKQALDSVRGKPL